MFPLCSIQCVQNPTTELQKRRKRPEIIISIEIPVIKKRVPEVRKSHFFLNFLNMGKNPFRKEVKTECH